MRVTLMSRSCLFFLQIKSTVSEHGAGNEQDYHDKQMGHELCRKGVLRASFGAIRCGHHGYIHPKNRRGAEEGMKKVFNILFNLIATLVGADCDWRREDVEAGIVDFSGQGRDKYGK